MKKYINKIWVLTVAVVCFSITSCSDVTELNVDPNNPTDVPAANLLTQAQYSLYNRMHSRVLNAEWSMLMVQHWSQNEYAEESRYLVDSNSFDGSWVSFYASVLNELTVAKNKISADENLTAARKANQLGIVDILMADAFQAVTDLWGDVPFSEALSPEFPNPTYDSQQSIYASLLSSLDNALTSLDVNAGSFDTGDIVAGGDVAQWKRIGASLLLRMAMRVSDVDNGSASTYVTKALAHGPISSNAENAIFNFDSANPDLSNPLYIDNVINTRDDFAVSDVLVTSLEAKGDPRIEAFAALNNDMVYRGMPYGLNDADAFALKSVTSRPSARVRDAAAPHVIIDWAEVAFLLAEAMERGYTSGNAADMYNAGVESSMAYWGYDDASGYLANNPYDAANWKESIGYEKWVAFYMNGPQAWAEWRRLDAPSLAVPAAASNPSIPVRLPYPISEETNNGNSLDAATSDANDLNGKVWWDVN
ncbi:MAG: SusD/RagB family nutrient-binding outer membrane lipoprotein [Saprospiraceae bacterium]|nr:SusD/RagB family nutrient-binding outer membrane lipoprotein [Bacteroidia bacterium]NNE16291.1 SusD/RagB family nutrient-binding outer membrane lipoprotein [Saprospiraceae bacterium]